MKHIDTPERVTAKEVWWQRVSLDTPARRHKCEFCSKIFICHLCTISHTHFLHYAKQDDHNNTEERGHYEDKRQHYFRCVPCIQEAEQPWVVISHMMRVNEITGERIGKRAHRASRFNSPRGRKQ